MKLEYPSSEFDEVLAALCHGQVSDEILSDLYQLLSENTEARDEYILRMEIHSRLASDSALFSPFVEMDAPVDHSEHRSEGFGNRKTSKWFWWNVGSLAVAACLLVSVVGFGLWSILVENEREFPTSRAVAMLEETIEAVWEGKSPLLGDPLEPGWLNLKSGLAQIAFYDGARVVIEGPAELKLVSNDRAVFKSGKITANVPLQAKGFQIETPQGEVTDLGTRFGLDVKHGQTELHVFEGEVQLDTENVTGDSLDEGSGMILEQSGLTRHISANRRSFENLFAIDERSRAASAKRLNDWRISGQILNDDPTLLTRFDFEETSSSRWQLNNVSQMKLFTGDATVVGCRWGQGRWSGKQALQFQNVNDRVRLTIPGEYEQLTVALWVQVQGLDRKLNSLFMCDGFEMGSLHWLIRNDGVIGMTVVGQKPGDFQIIMSPPVLTLDKFGRWMHLAVVVDGEKGTVTQYLDGQVIGESKLRIKPPYRIGTAELGNWNKKGFPDDDPSMIRNFSGAMDEFCLFSRGFEGVEIQKLYQQGSPDPSAPQSHLSVTVSPQ